MFEPQDLPGRFGRVVTAIDRVLSAIDCEAVVGGGWAVWRHGYFARMTHDIDIVLPADRIDDFLQAAAVSGFKVLAGSGGNWPKLLHSDSDVSVDILPEGARPGTPSNPAPTVIPPPSQLGGAKAALRYIELAALVELKLAAGRARDVSDVVELIRANSDQTDTIRQHLSTVHDDYVTTFDDLLRRAAEQEDR